MKRGVEVKENPEQALSVPLSPEYLTALPDEKVLASELEKTRKTLETRK